MANKYEYQAEAFERKSELGGGFRGVAVVKDLVAGTKTRLETEVCNTQQSAWVAITAQLWAIATPTSAAHFRSNKFRKNYFVAA